MVQLSDFFRRSLAVNPMEDLTLSEEVDLQRLYLEIERTRFPDRLRFDVALDGGSAEARVPALLLQPLVENAVKHGVARSEGPTCIASVPAWTGPCLRSWWRTMPRSSATVPEASRSACATCRTGCARASATKPASPTVEIPEGGFRNTLRMPVRH